MKEKLRNLLISYSPFFFIVIYRFLSRYYKHFCLERFCRISANKSSSIYALLKENWKNYKTDLYPQNRMINILEEKNVSGMSTENIRFFVNEAVRRFAKNGLYLEVGTLHGCSLLSASLFNQSSRCVGIDNFSQFDPEHKNKLIFKKNLEKFGNPKNIEFYDQDYREAISNLFSKEPGLKINIYYYDGEHSYKNQIEGLNIILPYLAHKCIILVDDINWEEVQEANERFLRENKDFKCVFKIKTKCNMSIDWWNGFEVITRGL